MNVLARLLNSIASLSNSRMFFAAPNYPFTFKVETLKADTYTGWLFLGKLQVDIDN